MTATSDSKCKAHPPVLSQTVNALEFHIDAAVTSRSGDALRHRPRPRLVGAGPDNHVFVGTCPQKRPAAPDWPDFRPDNSGIIFFRYDSRVRGFSRPRRTPHHEPCRLRPCLHRRVSPSPRPPARRVERAGCDRVFEDHASGVAPERPNLTACLDSLWQGEVLVVLDHDRFGRHTSELTTVIDELDQRGVAFRTLNSPMDTTTPAERAFPQIQTAFAEMESNVILQRVREGVKAARAQGRVPPHHDPGKAALCPEPHGRPDTLDSGDLPRARRHPHQHPLPLPVAAVLSQSWSEEVDDLRVVGVFGLGPPHIVLALVDEDFRRASGAAQPRCEASRTIGTPDGVVLAVADEQRAIVAFDLDRRCWDELVGRTPPPPGALSGSRGQSSARDEMSRDERADDRVRAYSKRWPVRVGSSDTGVEDGMSAAYAASTTPVTAHVRTTVVHLRV